MSCIVYALGPKVNFVEILDFVFIIIQFEAMQREPYVQYLSLLVP